jgi:hypothetical protein
MKTSVDIDDTLFARVKAIADAKGLSMRSMIESGLQFLVREHHKDAAAYQLPDARFKGVQGFAPGASEQSIAAAIREMNDVSASEYFK